MTLAIKLENPPLQTDEQGTIRIGNTRVTLDTLIGAFNAGYSPEEIVINFDTLDLADVYSVIGYYLHHKIELDLYLAERVQQAQELRQLIEARQNNVNLRERLLARKVKQVLTT